MSSTIIKSFKATKDMLYFVLGDSNIIPHDFHDWSEETTDDNIINLIEGFIGQWYQPYASIKLGQFSMKVRKLCYNFMTVSSWNQDWRLGVDRERGFIKMFSKTLGLYLFKQCFFHEEFNLTKDSEAKAKLIAYENESKIIYETKEKELKEKGIIHVHCALSSNIFPGHDILIDDNDCFIIAKQKNYDNKGHLDNSDNSAVFLKGIESSSKHLYFLYDGSSLSSIEDKVYNDIENILLNENKDLYNQFHVLTVIKSHLRSTAYAN